MFIRCFAPVAQSVEQLPFKDMVAGSIPAGRTALRKICLAAVFFHCVPGAKAPIDCCRSLFRASLRDRMHKWKNWLSHLLLGFSLGSIEAYTLSKDTTLTLTNVGEWILYTLTITLFIWYKKETITVNSTLVWFVLIQGVLLGAYDVYTLDVDNDSNTLLLYIFLHRLFSYDMVVSRVLITILLLACIFFDRFFPNNQTP